MANPARRERRKNKSGYWEVRLGDDWVLEHRLLVSTRVGVRLTHGLLVHHRDRDPHNNEPENLLLCPSEEEHAKLHKAIDNENQARVFEIEARCEQLEQLLKELVLRSVADPVVEALAAYPLLKPKERTAHAVPPRIRRRQ